MASQINLIPEKRGKVEATPLSRSLQKLVVVLVVVAVIGGIAGGAFWYTRNQELVKLEARREELKNEVLRLQQNEGKLVLLRDRLSKAQTVLADRGQYDSLEFFDSFVDTFGGNVKISEIAIEKGINKATLVVADSVIMSQVVNQLENSSVYPNITLENVSFSANTGYTIIVSVL